MAQHDVTLVERLRQHAREKPETAAYIWNEAVVTWAELDRASDAFAARLQVLGVKKGDPVAMFLGNCPQYVMAHFGIQKAGAIVCPCGPLYKEHELHYQLGDLKTRVLVADAALLPVVEKVRARTAIERVFTVRPAELTPAAPPPGCEDFVTAISTDAKPAPVHLTMSDVGLMTYTSGTTGLPKGAMLTHGNALFKTAACVECNDVRQSDVMLAIAPLYHLAGMIMGMDVPVYAGATTVLLPRFDPLVTLETLARHQVTWWYSIAPMNVALMALPEMARANLSRLRMNAVTSFGIAYTDALAARWRTFATSCTAFELAYGLSETHTIDTYMPKDDIRWGTHGKAVPGNQIRVIDPATGVDVAANEIGEIVVRGPGNFAGYWNKPEATAKTLRDGAVYTGDMGRLDEGGYLTFIGRFKEMIKVSGYSVFPEEVETILVKHPAVAQAAVIGVPDVDRGEVVRAFLVLRSGQTATAEEMVAWARENMAIYKAPREVRFLEALPATGAGKVLRRLLADQT